MDVLHGRYTNSPRRKLKKNSEKCMIFYYNCSLELKVTLVHITQVQSFFRFTRSRTESRKCKWLHMIISIISNKSETHLGAQRVKYLPVTRETWVPSLDWEDPLEKGMTTHSSILAWRIPWSEESGGLQSMGSQRIGHDLATNISIFLFFTEHEEKNN